MFNPTSVSISKIRRLFNPVTMELNDAYFKFLILRNTPQDRLEIRAHNYDVFMAFLYSECGNKSIIECNQLDYLRFFSWYYNYKNHSTEYFITMRGQLSGWLRFINANFKGQYGEIDNCVSRIPIPKTPKKTQERVYKASPRVAQFTTDECQQILDMWVDKRRYDAALILAFCMSCILQPEEIAKLKVEYFDIDEMRANKIYAIPQKLNTRGVYHTVYVATEMVVPYYEAYMWLRQQRGVKSKWLFPHRNNKKEPISSHTTSSIMHDSYACVNATDSYNKYSFQWKYSDNLRLAGLDEKGAVATVPRFYKNAIRDYYNDAVDRAIIDSTIANNSYMSINELAALLNSEEMN